MAQQHSNRIHYYRCSLRRDGPVDADGTATFGNWLISPIEVILWK